MDNKLIIVAGVSSAGKSTLIESVILPQLKAEGLNTDEDVDIKFAGRLLQNFDLGNKPVCIVHYNLLLQFDSNPQFQHIDLSSEPVCTQLLKNTFISKVYLCYAPDNILRDRITHRTELEPVIAPDDNRYPSARILENFKKIDQRALLLEFGEKFRNLAGKLDIVFSTDEGHSILTWEDFKYAIPGLELEQAISDKTTR